MNEKQRGILLVLSGPSGVGKGTVGKKLRASDDNISFSVSVTTRGMREGETPGVDYLYITEDEFAAMEEKGKLLESALVHGKHYGTPEEPVDRQLAEGKDVLLEIDPQGAQTVIRKRPPGLRSAAAWRGAGPRRRNRWRPACGTPGRK